MSKALNVDIIMRILQVIPVFSDSFGGPVTVVHSVSKELAKRHDVVVYTTTALDSRHDFDPKEEEVDGYRVIYFKRTLKPLCYTGFFGQLNLSFGMMKAVKGNLSEFDLVHVHSWQQFPDVMVHHYATKYRVPFVLQVHGSLPRIIAKQTLKWIFDLFFGYTLLRDASKVVALTQTEAQQYLSMGVPKEKIVIIPNGIDLSEYANLPPKRSFKKKFNIPENNRIILYLGRIHKTKGIDLLVKSYAYLVKSMKYDNTVLVIAGPDDGYLDEIKSLTAHLNVSDSVLFTGFISTSDKLKALVDADVFVTPSFYGFPVTFLEAGITGTPIVTTSLGDTLDWIEGCVGYVTLPTCHELARAMQAILSNDDLRQQFSRNSRRITQSEFSSAKVIDRLEQVYQEVAGK